MFKLITLATILIGAVNCYQEIAYSNYQDYFQEPVKPQPSGLDIARQAFDGLSSGGAALIGVVSFEGFFSFWLNYGISIRNQSRMKIIAHKTYLQLNVVGAYKCRME